MTADDRGAQSGMYQSGYFAISREEKRQRVSGCSGEERDDNGGAVQPAS